MKDSSDTVKGASEARKSINEAKKENSPSVHKFRETRKKQISSISGGLGVVRTLMSSAFNMSNPLVATIVGVVAAVLIGFIAIGLWSMNFLGMRKAIEKAFRMKAK